MTWIVFSEDWAYRCQTYTEKFKAGDHVNRPRHVAEAAVRSGKARKEVKEREKQGKDETNIPEAG